MADAVAAFAALQLEPSNAHQLERLERATTLVLENSRGHQPLTLQAAAAFASTDPQMRKLARLEDPAENVLCEEVLGPGGGFLVGSGLSDQSVFVLKLISRALFQYAPVEPDLVNGLLDPFHAALAISDRTLRAAGLSRGLPRRGAPTEQVDIPKNGAQLLEAAQLSLADHPELEALLAPLLQHAGEALSPSLSSPARPFVVADGRLIVAYPFEIAAALRHLVADQVVKAGLESQFSLRLMLTAAALLDASMRRLGMTQLGPPEDFLPEEPLVPFSGAEALYRFDDDKVAHAMLIVDDLSGYDPTQLFQVWQTAALEGHAHARARRVQEHLLRRSDVDAVHSLFVVVPLDRGMQFTVPSSLKAIFLPLYDLETFALACPNDPLALWKLSNAIDDLASAGELVSFSALDVHQFLEESDYDIPVLDEPTLIVARPGGGGTLREEQAYRFDVHPVPHPSGVGVEVERWLPHAPRVPIYIPRESPWTDFECLVEGSDLFLWVVGPNSEAGRAIGHAMAYWLWQALPDLESRVEELMDANGALEVRFALEPASRWGQDDNLLTEEPPDPPADPFADVRSSDGSQTLVLTETARLQLHAADNSGERELLRAVLSFLLPGSSVVLITEVVERHAPPGYKKQLIFAKGPDPRLSVRGLPEHFRPVQAYDRSRAQSMLARRLLDERPRPSGQVADDDAQELLHRYVGYAFDELQARVARFAPDDCLERLILFNERCVQEQAQLRTTTLTNALAYGEVDESLADRDNAQSRLAEASVAARFLIELVSSAPVLGTGHMSLSDFDELLALAAELTHAGRISDAFQFGLGDPKVALLDGRLAVSPGEAVSASLAAFQSELATAQLATGEEPLEELVWTPPPEPVQPPHDLDEALRDELGISLGEIGVFLSALLDYGIDTEAGVVNASLGTIRSVLTEAGLSDDSRITIALERFSLSPRHDFLTPPAPAGKSDVYPWRTNRLFSFIRRPLVRRGDRLLYGVRHLYTAQSIFARQLEGGNFPAQGAKLRRLQGKYWHRRGRNFENAVASLFAEHDYPHRVRVRTMQGRRLAVDGHDPGDIDILVADERTRRLIAIEAKSLGVALNPDQMLRQSEQLLGTKRSAAARLRSRSEWLSNNLDAAAADFGNPAIVSWKVAALVVTDAVLPAAHLAVSPVPVLSYGLLKSQLNSGERLGARSRAAP